MLHLPPSTNRLPFVLCSTLHSLHADAMPPFAKVALQLLLVVPRPSLYTCSLTFVDIHQCYNWFSLTEIKWCVLIELTVVTKVVLVLRSKQSSAAAASCNLPRGLIFVHGLLHSIGFPISTLGPALIAHDFLLHEYTHATMTMSQDNITGSPKWSVASPSHK